MRRLWAVCFIASAAITLLQAVLVMVAWDRYIAAAVGAKPLGFWGALVVTVAIQSLKLKVEFRV
jgi:hypothetical protein